MDRGGSRSTIQNEVVVEMRGSVFLTQVSHNGVPDVNFFCI
jgi:hypothetical protein